MNNARRRVATRRFWLLLPMFIWVTSSAFAQTTWTGGIDASWEKPGNWSAGVPDAADDVIIPDVTNDPVIAGGTAALAQSVLIQASGLLTINASGSLTINGFATYSTPSEFTAGLNNLGTVNNSGNLTLGAVASVGKYGMINQGSFINKTGGEIHIDRTTDTGIFQASGTFTNEANIAIGVLADIGLHGIWNNTTFNNTAGTIRIDRATFRGLVNYAEAAKSINATFTNSATITITNATTVSAGTSTTAGSAGIETRGAFNNAGGAITIDRTSGTGLYHADGPFTNAAEITIGATEPAGNYGLSSWGTFNHTGGHIRIDRTSEIGLLNASGAFTNSASITIGGVAGVGATGVENQAIFTNHAGADLHIDRSSYVGLHQAASTFTNSGTVTIGASEIVGTYGLISRAAFTNQGSGQISIDRYGTTALFHRSDTFTNAATITIGAQASVGLQGIKNDAIFNNTPGGTIYIDRTSEWALMNNGDGAQSISGTFTNAANIFIGANTSVGAYGVWNKATFNNNAGGHIRIDRSTDTGLYHASGTFTNAADLTIGAKATVGYHGLWNSATFTNTGGTTKIDRTSLRALVNHADELESISGTFTNSATITIGSIAAVGHSGIENRGTFNNTSGGAIAVDRSDNYGINLIAGTITNAAAITIGGIAGVGYVGIRVQEAGIFKNNAGGNIHIDRSTTAGVYIAEGSFTNSATLTIGGSETIGQYGIYNYGVFSNAGGHIRVDRSTKNGVYNASNIGHSGSFTNSATITIGGVAGVGEYGIYNVGPLNNSGGTISIDRFTEAGIFNTKISNDQGKGTVTNEAAITIGAAESESSGKYGIVNEHSFTNTGTGGHIRIDRSGEIGLYNRLGTFTNAAAITIGGVANVGATGLENQATFSNITGGNLKIDRSSYVGLHNITLTAPASFTNAGTLTIGAQKVVMQYGIINRAAFANQTGGQINIDHFFLGGLDIEKEDFANAGTVTIGALTPADNKLLAHFNESFGSTFTNKTGGVFKGTGSIDGANFLHAGGTLSPGYSPGWISFNGSRDFGTSTLEIDVKGTGTAGVDYDQISVNYTATISGTLTVSINYTPTNGDEVTLLKAPWGLNGTFSSATVPSGWTVVYTANDVKLVYQGVAAVPSLTDFTASSATVCAGNPVTFTATVGNVTGSYAYTLTNGNTPVTGTSSSNPFSQTLVAGGSGTQSFTLTIYASEQLATATSELVVAVTPSVPNLTSTTVTQGNPAVSLTASNCLGTISWTGPGGSSGTGAITVVTSTPGAFVYQAVCTANACTSDPASVTVVVNAPTVTGSFDGFIYGADCATFRGWAWDRNKPNTVLSIDILDGANVIATLMADQFRQDLVNAGKGNGKHAFIWSIPEILKDGLPHNLSARVTGNSFVLKDSPKALICQGNAGPGGNRSPQPPTPTVLITPVVAQVGVPFSGTLVAFTDPDGDALTYALSGLPEGLSIDPTTRVISGTPTEAGTFVLAYSATDGHLTNSVSFPLTVQPASTTTMTGSFEGYLDKLDCGGIRGWVWDRNKPNTPLTVEFYLEPSPGNITVLGSTLANSYRQDLKDAGKGNGAHAYQFTPPGSVTNGTLVLARVLGSNFVLKGSPKAFQCAPARLSAEQKPELQVTVLGNPVRGDQVAVEIRGAEGQAVFLELTDAGGRLVSQRQIDQAKAVERQSLSVGQQPAGLFFLRVQQGGSQVTLKIQKL
ncbi:putative Ig domain-containing protein [Larkinella sp. C7]|uniref:putative Ig domain-containing protein n=1 Tax=Larkinella sp. C7 TaxID=2576607 RepID=UPI001486067F|nr:putative Ig domain-containing protein [Larkinella sp. C7]